MRITGSGHVVRALTVAGSDSGGGAGIQADLKTFAAYEVYGASVITGLTAQNTLGVQGVQYIDPAFVQKQLDSVLGDIGADAVKTGMLGSAEIIAAVAGRLAVAGVDRLVVDPVMIAKGGEALIDGDAVATLRQRLLPLARVVTPNIPEAEVLTGFAVDSWSACHRAAEALHRLGPKVVVIKGGHSQAGWLKDAPWDSLETQGHAVDIVYDGDRFTYLATPRVPSRKTHGTGCTFSSATAAGLALGWTDAEAIASAKAFIYAAIASAADWDVGAGHGPTDHSVRPAPAAGIQAGGAYRLVDGQWERLEGGC